MSRLPQPLFDTFECFHELNFLQLSNERSTVQEYLKSFDDSCRAIESYLIVRSFLKSYAGNQSTFNSFRTHVERLLLWTLIVARKPPREVSPVPEALSPALTTGTNSTDKHA
ncbi:hypothetical protein ACOI9X_04140 [Pseudomonas sp. P2757]|uniref:hypothetical protein n=1 Tax=unclassified Pseudomonas TaxID=196821 RepID=UPI003B593614